MMKRTAAILSSLLLGLALAGPARSQDIFDLLRKGDVAAVKAMVEKSPRLVEASDGTGNTPLHIAALGGDAGLIHYLVDKGDKL
jgi:ankyrin repeat protein